MSIAIDIRTMDGVIFTLQAKEDWSISALKRSIEEATRTRPFMQKLISVDGVELVSGPLRQFCPEGSSDLELTLVKISPNQHVKSEQDLAWSQRWSESAPPCLQKASKIPVGKECLDEIRELAAECPRDAPFVYARGLGVYGSPHHPTKVLHSDHLERQVETKPPSTMESCREVLAVVKKTRLDLDSLIIQGKEVTLKWKKSRVAVIERKASLEAVLEAIAEDPCAMLDVRSTADDCGELVLQALKIYPGLYDRLPDHVTEDCEVLYAAIESDPQLKTEFLNAADKADIRNWQEWRWPTGKSECRWSKRCKDIGDV